MDSRQIAVVYLGELLDRVLRFEMHLGAVEDEFYRRSTDRGESHVPRERPLFLDSFHSCVSQLLKVVFQLGKRAQEPLDEEALHSLMGVARHAFVCLDRLHRDGLSHLPRPSEPTELRRFLRMISKHVLKREKPDLAVYMTEGTTETSFAEDPLGALRERFSGLGQMSDSFTSIEATAGRSPIGDTGIHVTIARIDARNPLRWPTLIHEAAHRLLSSDAMREILNETTRGLSLNEAFLASIRPSVQGEIDRLGIKTEAWLPEVWCDLFGALVLGPAFFFGQFAAFITGPPCDPTISREYPPHGCRLRLIRAFLQHRHEVMSSALIRKHMDECLELVEYWDSRNGLDIGRRHELKVLSDAMRIYFQDLFFSGPEGEGANFQRKFAKMVQYALELEMPGLTEIQKAFADGLPAPSKRRSVAGLEEEPTSIQEVLLAAWLDRLERLRDDRLTALISGATAPAGEADFANLLQGVERFDNAVLLSLQLAEWLHVLAPEAAQAAEQPLPALLGEPIRTESGSSLLNDKQINALLSSGELRVVPLVDLDHQVGSASFDIRLGTSFEIYLPAYRRSPTVADEHVPDAYDSRPIDLDFLEHVVLLPGQIVLAHSFEYLRLPATIAGELEGRSSYARLGLQVHLTAGMIDPGFEGVITFELVNNGPNPIPLFPGLRVAQLRLFRVDQPARPYSSRHGAKYRRFLHHHTSLYKSDPEYGRLDSAIRKQREEGHRPPKSSATASASQAKDVTNE